MEIEFDVSVRISQDFIDHAFYTEDKRYTPSIEEIVFRVIEDIDGHGFFPKLFLSSFMCSLKSNSNSVKNFLQ